MNVAFIAAADPDAGVDDDHGAAPRRYRASVYDAADLLREILARGRADRAAHHVLDDEIRAGRRAQQQRYGHDTVAEFEQAGRFTPAAEAARIRAGKIPARPRQPYPYQQPNHQGHGIGR